jgi:type I restriction enzyme S subunit
MKQGWELKKLGEVCDLMNGYAFQSKNYTDEGYFVIRIGNVQDGIIELNNARYIQLKEEKQKKFILQSGDILISLTGNVGRVGIINEAHLPAVLNQRVAKISIKNEIKLNKDFIFYFLTSEYFISSLIKAGRGAAQQNISTTDIENLEIPLPPLSEQQRIVAILDEAFANIAKAKANAEQNLKNAKELFDCVLNSILYDKKWGVKELGEVCSKVEYGSSTKSTTVGKIPVLRMGNIQNGRFTWDNLVYSDNKEDNKQYLLKFNDVLFNRTNSPALVGKTAIYKSEMPAIFAGYLIRLHRKEDLLDADFLNYYLNSKMANDYGKTVVISSVNQANINGTKLKTYPIPIPSLKEQQIIVDKLDALSVETKKLEVIYNQKLSDLEELKKSVLQKAFSGELKTEKVLV